MGEMEEGSLVNLEAVRSSLVRQEDTIIFSLIERSKYPINSRLYDPINSLLHFFIKQSEAVQAKVCVSLISTGLSTSNFLWILITLTQFLKSYY